MVGGDDKSLDMFLTRSRRCRGSLLVLFDAPPLFATSPSTLALTRRHLLDNIGRLGLHDFARVPRRHVGPETVIRFSLFLFGGPGDV